MGENEKLGFIFKVGQYDYDAFQKFFGTSTPWVDDECSTQVWNGSQRPSAEDYAKVGSSDAKFLTPHYIKDGMIVVDEMTPLDITNQGYTLSCRTNSQQLQKAVERLQEELSKPFPILFKKPTKRNKHYKPKFTL